ncbi:hypothetical protein [Novacetimonas pomaceti]|uniref:Uncharacterized protein n=1 Tax=Novacetimonas pomaceti TaxID=2021998 RepID=A0A318QSC8_9PROT|nr:hypothetical protein [Novacetimonas pomaceti]PYD75613.1 hypothetical protein CFR71_08590 [Novacetimonas pomaceti]
MAKAIPFIALPVLAAAGMAVVHACGPAFPTQLLDDRAHTLRTLPAGSFGYEASRLLPPDNPRRDTDPSPADAAAITPDPAPGDASPQDDGLGNTPAGRLYARGAAAYRAARAATSAPAAPSAAAPGTAAPGTADSGTGEDAAGDAGAQAFAAVLALPPAQAAPRAVKAAFMLGKIHAQRGLSLPPDGWPRERDAAIAMFTRVRALAAQGDPDPDGLALASWGEQARLFTRPLAWRDFDRDDLPTAAIAPADLLQAIHLYARQAAEASVTEAGSTGVDSLRLIARWALRDPGRVAMLVDDPLARRLMVAYALALGDEDGGGGNGGDNGAEDGAGNGGAATARPAPPVRMLADAIRARGLVHVPDADRLSALAYTAGDYDTALTLARQGETPLSDWVRAKLAIRDGDMAGAAGFYAAATRGFPTLAATPGATLEPGNVDTLKGEQGVVALSRGEYVQAFAFLYDAARDAGPYGDSGVSNDAAYVAERVLTIAELKDYVDAHIPAPVPPDGHDSHDGSGDDMPDHPRTMPDAIRALLARRMVRVGDIDGAIAYFPADDDPRYATAITDGNGRWTGKYEPSIRSWARAYGAALRRVGTAWTDTGRAAAWFDAANIARAHGMEIMGTEQDPDYAATDGAYDWGVGRYLYRFRNDGTDLTPLPQTAGQRAAQALSGPFIQDGERRRYLHSEVVPYQRFHYRNIAVTQAQRAADLLPPRSQAFAAVLCTAAGWESGDEADLYARYVRQGAYVPFARHFGKDCPAPDFRAAAYFPYRQSWRRARHDIRHGWLPFAGGAGAVALGAAFAWWKWRR